MEQTQSLVVIRDDGRTKNTVTPKAQSTKQMYAYYKRKYPEAKEPYWMYKEVVARFNKKAADAVIFGKVLNFGHRIGNLLIKKIRRNYENPIVDWGESGRLKAQIIESGQTPRSESNPNGPSWLVYFSDPWYLRWAWVKKDICRVKYSSAYKFTPTSDRSKKANNTDLSRLGNKGKLVLAVKLNPALTTLYSDWTRTKEKV